MMRLLHAKSGLYHHQPKKKRGLRRTIAAVGVDAPERAIVITPITPTMVITDRALICFLAILFENRLPILNGNYILDVTKSNKTEVRARY